MRNIRKYISSIVIFTIVISISIFSNAEDKSGWQFPSNNGPSGKPNSNITSSKPGWQFPNDSNFIGNETSSSPGWIFNPDGNGYFATSSNNKDLVFCVQLGGALRKKSIKDNLPLSYNGGTVYCNTCSPFGSSGRPAAGTDGDIGYTTEYESTQHIEYTEHQDIAYALAYGEGGNRQEKVQTVIWKSDLDASGGSDASEITASHSSSAVKYVSDEGLYEEASAYRDFYEEKEDVGGFYAIDNTEYEEVRTIADQEDDVYIIGLFSINYLEGIYGEGDDTVKFGYISDLKIRDQDGKKQKVLDIIDEDGESILDRDGYNYPHDGEEFYVKFRYDGKGDASKVHLDVDFEYLEECQANLVKWTGTIYEWGYVKKPTGSTHHNHCKWCSNCDDYHHSSCKSEYTYELEKGAYDSAQDLLTVYPFETTGRWAEPIWKEVNIENEDDEVDITMQLAGIVFLDIPDQKDTTKVNGKYDKDFDKPLKDIEVTLYEEDGTLAELAEEDGEIRTNPTLTDENGYYEFKGIDSQRKYYVTYKINGQYLENTKYRVEVEEYNTEEWKVSSKASILDKDRTEYNTKFEHIHSSPSNYTTINNITGFNLSSNKTYNIYDQTYDKAQQEANDIKTLQEAINSKIHEYIEDHEEYPNDSEKTRIYGKVASEHSNISEVKNKIQYIVDIEVIAKTGYKSSMQYYPVYDQFVIDDEEITIGDITYEPIYEGQNQINFGTIEREKFDLKLTKDLYKARITINNKEYIYHYNSRNQENVEIEIRGSDLPLYERELRETDIQYIDYINNNDRKLRVYLTYKIRITNQSDSFITGYVTNLNDFYDSDYTFLNSNVVKYNEQGIESENVLNWNNDTANHKLTTDDSAISNLPIQVSEYIDIFNVFEVNTDAIQRLLTEHESTKENYAEIAGYKTYYTNRREFDGNDVINEAGYVAGLVDRDSRPGDFEVTDEVRKFVEYSYTDNFKSKDGETKTKESLTVFQDDADKAPGLKLKLLEIVRELYGNVWEDATLSDILKNENIRRGDGINNDNHPIKDMKVELINMDDPLSQDIYPYNHTNYNKVADIYNAQSKKFETAVTYTAQDGSYEFKGYVPGDYLVRYTYGEGKTLTTDSNGKVYNGQDYKSTLYTEEKHNVGTNENPNYWYTAEHDGQSDAHDNYSLRNAINSKNSTMNNHIATVLDYQVATGSIDTDNTLKELQDRSIIYADTNKLVLEVEYAKRESIYTLNVQEYKVNNIDFGITERPRSELKLEKDVANIRIIANSGQTLFDAEDKTTNLGWLKPSTRPYEERHGLISVTMDENLMHGATLKVLYNFKITNTGERDYIDQDGGIDISYYNTGVPTGKLVTTKASYIVDYIENNMKFSPDNMLDNIDKEKYYNQFWTEVTDKKELNTGDDSRLVNVDMDILNSYITIIKATENSPLLKELKPSETKREDDGESASTTLLLTKVLNTSSESKENITYNNSVEVVRTNNDTGRRHYNNRDKSEYKKDLVSDTVKSIPGNYNPTTVTQLTYGIEPDTDLAETVVINEPLGEQNKIPFVIGTVIAVIILAGGIYIIKKKVLR